MPKQHRQQTTPSTRGGSRRRSRASFDDDGAWAGDDGARERSSDVGDPSWSDDIWPDLDKARPGDDGDDRERWSSLHDGAAPPDDEPGRDPDLDLDQRWSTWLSVEKGQRGPEPRPEWVVTAAAAIDTELGVLKTGKEADVFLVERAVPDDPDRRALLAAKRYRDLDHRSFRRDSLYTEDRRTRRTRDRRALNRKSTYGRQVAAGQWAMAEFASLCELWSAGAPVPYPVQIDGTEILMEFVGTSGPDGHEAAPRLARTRPDADLLAAWWDQLRDAMAVLARLGYAHGDLSPYNVLADGDRLVVIDLPQVVDLVANPFGTELLLRDCRTMCAWFTARGLDADPDELLGELLAQAW